MAVREPAELHRLWEEAYNSGDIDALAALYEPGAAYVTEPGKVRVFDVDGDANAEHRAGYLPEARALGAGLVAPDRVPRHMAQGAVRTAA